jgi:hypothetical protein
MRPGHLPELVDTAEAGKGDELPDIPLVILPGVAVASVGEPLGFWGNGRQGRELGGGEAVRGDGSELGVHRGIRCVRGQTDLHAGGGMCPLVYPT